MRILLVIMFSLICSAATAELVRCENTYTMQEWGAKAIDKVTWVDEVYIWTDASRLSKVMYTRNFNDTTYEFDCLDIETIHKNFCFDPSYDNSFPDNLSYRAVAITHGGAGSDEKKWGLDIIYYNFEISIDNESKHPTEYDNATTRLPSFFKCNKPDLLEFLKYRRP